jgi:hypothetical protein
MDFPLLTFQTVAKVTNLGLFSGGGSIDVQGRDFTGASAVLINGVRSPTFVIISDTRLLADVPATQLGVPIRSLSVLRRTPAVGENSVISFEAAVPSSMAMTSTYLVQKVLKHLLTTPGSDIFSQRTGGGLLNLIGPIPTDPGSIYPLVTLQVRTTVEEIVTQQAADIGTPPEERLSGVEVIEASYSERDTSLDVRLRIISSSGVSVIAGLSL